MYSFMLSETFTQSHSNQRSHGHPYQHINNQLNSLTHANFSYNNESHNNHNHQNKQTHRWIESIITTRKHRSGISSFFMHYGRHQEKEAWNALTLFPAITQHPGRHHPQQVTQIGNHNQTQKPNNPNVRQLIENAWSTTPTRWIARLHPGRHQL